MTGLETGTSYFDVMDVRHAERDLDRFRDAGLDAVLHTFSERDREYFERTKADLVAASHDRDFTVYVNPWAVGGVFGGEAYSGLVAREPSVRQRLASGERVPAACFNDPDFREYVRGWTRDAVDIGADVLFWDEPHWYNVDWFREYAADDWSCRCEHCRERYRERFDEPMPVTETEAVTRFREESLLDFLDEMMALGHERGAENAVCLMPKKTADYGFSDWSRVATNDHLDVLATDPYWEAFGESNDPESFVAEFGETVSSLAADNDLRSQLWVQGFDLEAGAAADVRAATRAALDVGVDSLFTWGYDGCRTISGIAADEPDAVWDAFLDELP
ncbi:hypothetical protein [Halomicrococcus sp. NG-SE-24]|uniref:hypothetical protein n=1 Tax=Halomicrococcus sp. NG-SE-24 TaxID=3436928 RepID=UPI003D9901B7